MNGYRVQSRSESRDAGEMLGEFLALPARTRRAPFDLGLLSPDAERLLLLLPGFGERELWVARHGAAIVGRIGASVSVSRPDQGSIGFLELVDGHEDAAPVLIRAAETWLARRGVSLVIGPMCLNTWFPYRYRVDADDGLFFSWEPVNPPAYPQLIAAAGYEHDMGYHSELLADIGPLADSMDRKLESSPAADYSYRPVRLDDLGSEIPRLHDLSMRSFRDNYLFEPIALPVFEQLYVAQARKRDTIGSFYAVDPHDGEVGYIISFEDEAGQYVIKTLAVVPEHQGKALSFGLMHHTLRAALARCHTGVVGAMLQSGNRSEFAARRSGLGWQHRYALFRKSLATR